MQLNTTKPQEEANSYLYLYFKQITRELNKSLISYRQPILQLVKKKITIVR